MESLSFIRNKWDYFWPMEFIFHFHKKKAKLIFEISFNMFVFLFAMYNVLQPQGLTHSKLVWLI